MVSEPVAASGPVRVVDVVTTVTGRTSDRDGPHVEGVLGKITVADASGLTLKFGSIGHFYRR